MSLKFGQYFQLNIDLGASTDASGDQTSAIATLGLTPEGNNP